MNYANVTMSGTPTKIVADKIIVDRGLCFLSIIGYKNIIDNYVKRFTQKTNRNDNVYISYRHEGSFLRNAPKIMHDNTKYNSVVKRINEDLSHAIIYLETVADDNIDTFDIYIYINSKGSEEANYQELEDKVFEIIENYSNVPFLKEWTHATVEALLNSITYSYEYKIGSCYLKRLDTESGSFQTENNMLVYKLHIRNQDLRDYISYRLSIGEFNIDGSNQPSMLLEVCNGLNDYLDIFGEILAKKIQNNFEPKFTPDKDKYDYYVNLCDDFIHNNGKELFEAQKAVIQAIVNNWKINNNTMLIGECGVGKTIIGEAAAFSHHANIRRGFNAIVMCPTHIVEKWKREIEENIPNAKGYIVHNLKELNDLRPKLTNEYRIENMFVIISKEVAKFSYDTRPCAKWKTYKISKYAHYDEETNTEKAIYKPIITGHFVCPECGKPLYRLEKIEKKYVKIDLTELDFLSENSYNRTCPHCKSKLWTTLNKDEENCNWIKVGKEGWLYKDHLEDISYQLSTKEKTNKKEKNLLAAATKQLENVDEYGEYKVTYKGVKRYSVAKYIKDKFKGIFEYGIFDEVHSLSSRDSIQGQAFHHLLLSCKKNLAMTGTLINGYADSIYYILYKMYPKLMKKKGFKYEDVNIFADKYGATSYQYKNPEELNYRTRTKDGPRKKKKLPGISPLIFTEYLFNSSVFISLKDMKNELPNYTEIPVGVQMTEDIEKGYREYETFMRETVLEAQNSKEKKSLKIIAPLIKEMMNYPDAPHCAKPVLDPDTEEVRFSPTVLEKDVKPKEFELISILEDKISKGEKVLIYYNAVHTTDIGKQLYDLITQQGFNAYELKANIKSEKRESIIRNLVDNEFLDVLICNPSLVETGLDLIDFTTIIFYQVGYNLYTLRQSSRRSWRLSQQNDVTVYYLYYTGTVQEKALSLMATKLHAAKTVEGDFDEEGLKAMSDNTDMLTQIANNVVSGMECTLDTTLFASTNYIREEGNKVRDHKLENKDIEVLLDENGNKIIINEWNKAATNEKLNNALLDNPLRLFI